MDELQRTYNKINKLTTLIASKYPELYRSLNENPLTIPTINNPSIDIAIMKDYLDSLEQLLAHHSKLNLKSA